MGVVPLYRLVLARPDAPVGEIMTADSVRVRTADDQEVVARVFRERRYLAVPVVDEDGRLVDDESLEHLVVHRLLRDRVAQTGSIRAVSWVGAVTLDGRVPSRAYWPCTTP